jgi:hypothetical protein
MKRFVGGLSARSFRLDPRPVNVGFMTDKVAADPMFLRVLRHSPAITTLSMLHTHPRAYYQILYNCTTNSLNKIGPGNSVGKATGYGLDGPGIKSLWGRDFPHMSKPTLGPTRPPVECVPGLSRG